MSKIDESSRLIIKNSVKLSNISITSKIYNIPYSIVEMYLMDVDQGTIWGRQVVRLEMARVKAEKEGLKDFKPSEMDKYKGGR